MWPGSGGKAEGYELSRCGQDGEAKLKDMSYPGVARIGRQSWRVNLIHLITSPT